MLCGHTSGSSQAATALDVDDAGKASIGSQIREGPTVLIITVVSGPDKGRVYRLADNVSHKVGRHRGSIALDDRSVSSGHAELSEAEGQWHVTDRGSSNGTFVNKRRLDPHESEPIEDGDRIQFGRTMVVFNLVAEVDPSATSARDLPTHHAALAIEERNQQMLEQIVQTLASQAEQTPHIGDKPVSAYDDSALRDMLQQVITRLDQPADKTPAADQDPRLDQILQTLRQIADRPVETTAPAPAPSHVDTDELTAKLDAVIEMVSSHSTGHLEHQLTELRDAITNAPAPAAPQIELPEFPAIPDPAEAVAPLAAKLDALQQRLDELKNQPEDPAHEDVAAALKPLLDDILEAVRNAPAPAKAVEAKVDKLLAATAVDGRAYIAPKLEAILEAVNTSNATALTDKLDAILEAAERDNTADVSAKLDALRQALPQYDDQPLQQKLDALLEATQAEPDTALVEKLDQLLEAVQRDNTTALTDKLDAMLAAMPQYDDQPLREKLDEIITAVQRDQTAELSARLDQVIDAVQRDPSAALSAKLDEVLEAVTRRDDDSDAQPADNTELLTKLDAVLEAAQVDRSAQIAAKLEAAIETFQGPRHEALQKQIESLQQALLSTADQQSPPAIDPSIIEKLDAVLERVQQQPEPAAAPEPVDLSPVQQQLGAIRQSIEQLQQQPAAGSSAEGDGDGEVVDRKLDVLIDAASAANQSTGELAEKLDTIIIELADQRDDDVESRLTRALETMLDTADNTAVLDALSAVRQRLDAITEQQQQPAEQPEPIDPAPAVAEKLQPALDQILQAVRELPAPEPDKSADELRPLLEQVLEKVNTPAPAPQAPDMAPQFDKLHTTLTELRDQLLEAATAPTESPASPEPVDLSPVIDQLATLQQRLDQMPAPVDASTSGGDLRPMLQQVLEAVEAQRETGDTDQAQSDRFDELIDRIEKLDTKVAAGVPVDAPDHRPMLRRILEVVEHNHGKPDGVPTDEKQLETLLRKIHDRLNGLSAPANSERVLGDLFTLLRSIEQEQQRQADAIHLLAEKATRTDERIRDRLLDDDHEPAPRPAPAPRMTPASSVVVPHQPAPSSARGGRSVLVTIVFYVGLTLAILWGALSVADGRLFNPFGSSAVPASEPATTAPASTTPQTTRPAVETKPSTASTEPVQLSSRAGLP